ACDVFLGRLCQRGSRCRVWLALLWTPHRKARASCRAKLITRVADLEVVHPRLPPGMAASGSSAWRDYQWRASFRSYIIVERKRVSCARVSGFAPMVSGEMTVRGFRKCESGKLTSVQREPKSYGL